MPQGTCPVWPFGDPALFLCGIHDQCVVVSLSPPPHISGPISLPKSSIPHLTPSPTPSLIVRLPIPHKLPFPSSSYLTHPPSPSPITPSPISLPSPLLTSNPYPYISLPSPTQSPFFPSLGLTHTETTLFPPDPFSLHPLLPQPPSPLSPSIPYPASPPLPSLLQHSTHPS